MPLYITGIFRRKVCLYLIILRSGYSTTHSLISINETIRKTLDNNKFGCGVFIDFRKAFDTVNHSILL